MSAAIAQIPASEGEVPAQALQPDASPAAVADYPLEAPKKPKFLTTSAPATFDKVVLVSAFLGILIGYGCSLLGKNTAVGMYMIGNGVFHALEFWVTSRYNPSSLGMWSFCLTNGVAYALAQIIAACEMLAWRWQLGHWPYAYGVFAAGAILMVAGQAIRTAAMIQAATSFNHFIQKQKKSDHVLVEHGLYGIVRHPSYTGFAMWSIGMQLMVGNYLSTFLYTVTDYMFFRSRIMVEEKHLIDFFGDAYVSYKKRVPSGIPMVA